MNDPRASIITQNNRRVRAADGPHPNPRSLDQAAWHQALVGAFPAIADEWRAFDDGGRRLPRIEQLLDEHQGNEGSWRAGLLVAQGRPVPALAGQFPATVRALRAVPGLRYAIWSVLEPGAELPPHSGPNAGVLRYHLTVRSNPAAVLRVDDTETPYVAGEGILFDDTATHAAWNRGSTPRISLLCELNRPVPAPASWLNELVQRGLGFDRRYRLAARRAAEWDRALNHRPRTAPGP